MGTDERAVFKETLLRYNADDCAALELVVNAVLQVCLQPLQPVNEGRPVLEVAHADSIRHTKRFGASSLAPSLPSRPSTRLAGGTTSVTEFT